MVEAGMYWVGRQVMLVYCNAILGQVLVSLEVEWQK